MGFPYPLFALQMLGVIGSLLVVIFSFSLFLVVGAVAFNLSLYSVLLRLAHRPQLLNVAKVFPSAISNKKTTDLGYED